MTGQTLRQLAAEGEEILSSAGVPDAKLDSEYLLAEVLKVPRLNLLFSASSLAPEGARESYLTLIARRAGREPLQYILGSQPFYGRDFLVRKGVLIPRQDTEAVCESALGMIPKGKKVRVLDLCCGSGALGVTLALERPLAEVTATDLSPSALECAAENIRRLGAPVTLRAGDLWDAVPGQFFDMVVSNPPYIPDGDMPSLQKEVLWEPDMALRGGADGLDFYRRILSSLREHLNAGGNLCLECGDRQTGALLDMVSPMFGEAAAFSDLGGRPRGVLGKGLKP